MTSKQRRAEIENAGQAAGAAFFAAHPDIRKHQVSQETDREFRLVRKAFVDSIARNAVERTDAEQSFEWGALG